MASIALHRPTSAFVAVHAGLHLHLQHWLNHLLPPDIAMAEPTFNCRRGVLAVAEEDKIL
jgi:hypothetical protein